MDVVKTKIGDIEVLIESCGEKTSTDESGHSVGGLRNTMKTGSRHTTEKLADTAFEEVKKIISNMAKIHEKGLEDNPDKPDEFTLEFSLSFSAASNLWILGCESNAVMKVGMTWKSKDTQ